MADEILRSLQHRRPGLALRHAGDALELADRPLAARLLVVLELLEVDFAVADPLLPPCHLDQLLVELGLALGDPLLHLRGLDATVADLVLHLGAELHRSLTRLDERLAADRLRLTVGVRHDPAPLLLAPVDRGAARGTQPGGGDPRTHPEPDDQRDHREHVHSSRSLGCPRRRRGCSHPVSPPVREPVRCCVGLGRRALPQARGARLAVREASGRHVGHGFNEFGTARFQGNPDEARSS